MRSPRPCPRHMPGMSLSRRDPTQRRFWRNFPPRGTLRDGLRVTCHHSKVTGLERDERVITVAAKKTTPSRKTASKKADNAEKVTKPSDTSDTDQPVET